MRCLVVVALLGSGGASAQPSPSGARLLERVHAGLQDGDPLHAILHLMHRGGYTCRLNMELAASAVREADDELHHANAQSARLSLHHAYAMASAAAGAELPSASSFPADHDVERVCVDAARVAMAEYDIGSRTGVEAFDLASAKDTVVAYSAYLRWFPTGLQRDDAEHRIEDIQVRQALGPGTIADYQRVLASEIGLRYHARSDLRDQLASLVLHEAASSGALESFLAAFPDSRLVPEARRRLDELGFAAAEAEGIDALRRLVSGTESSLSTRAERLILHRMAPDGSERQLAAYLKDASTRCAGADSPACAAAVQPVMIEAEQAIYAFYKAPDDNHGCVLFLDRYPNSLIRAAVEADLDRIADESRVKMERLLDSISARAQVPTAPAASRTAFELRKWDGTYKVVADRTGTFDDNVHVWSVRCGGANWEEKDVREERGMYDYEYRSLDEAARAFCSRFR